MANGGRRPGAGRPRGSRDKLRVATEAVVEELTKQVEGKTPIEIWGQILSDTNFPLNLRLAVARDLAPYVHPKLSSTEAKVSVNMTHEEELDVLERVAHANGAINGKAN
jgi:hypothetical protein